MEKRFHVLYKGKEMTIHAIAQMENVQENTLRKYFTKINEIDEAVKLAKAANHDNKDWFKLLLLNNRTTIVKSPLL